MITYAFWIFIAAIILGVLYLMGLRLQQWKPALIVSAIILVISTSFYFFYLEQMFVKRWGGTMTINMSKDERHIALTWKDDNLWIENYDPKTNSCTFQEYSRGNMLEGRVVLKNCNPLVLVTEKQIQSTE